ILMNSSEIQSYRNIVSFILAVFIIVFVSVAVTRFIDFSHAEQLRNYSFTSLGLTQGHPHWRAYQNRLLCPFTVLALSNLTHTSYFSSFMVVSHLLVYV